MRPHWGDRRVCPLGRAEIGKCPVCPQKQGASLTWGDSAGGEGEDYRRGSGKEVFSEIWRAKKTANPAKGTVSEKILSREGPGILSVSREHGSQVNTLPEGD